MEQNIKQAIEQALSEAPERKFVETVEFAFTIKDVDLKNPSNRIQEEIRLPAGRGRSPSLGRRGVLRLPLRSSSVTLSRKVWASGFQSGL